MQIKYKKYYKALIFLIFFNFHASYAGNFFAGLSFNMQKESYEFKKQFPKINFDSTKIIELQKQIEINNDRIDKNKESFETIKNDEDFVSNLNENLKAIIGEMEDLNNQTFAIEKEDNITKCQASSSISDLEDALKDTGFYSDNTLQEKLKIERWKIAKEFDMIRLSRMLSIDMAILSKTENLLTYNIFKKMPENKKTQKLQSYLECIGMTKISNQFNQLLNKIYNFNTLYSANLQELLSKENKDLQNQLELLQIKSETLKNELRYQELASIQTSASGFSPSVSLLGGYALSLGNFGFITEVGVDLTKSDIGSNQNKQIELTNNYNLYLTQKLGYSFLQNTLTYITAGVGKKNYHAKYDGDYIKLDHKTKLNNLILGFGMEVKAINNRLGMFFELNNIIALSKIKTEIGTIKPNSYQARVGFRYYFNVNQNQYSNSFASIKEIKNSPFTNITNNAESTVYSNLDSNKVKTKKQSDLNNGRFKINNF